MSRNTEKRFTLTTRIQHFFLEALASAKDQTNKNKQKKQQKTNEQQQKNKIEKNHQELKSTLSKVRNKTVFADGMIICVESLKENTKQLIKQISEFSMISGYKVHM